MRVLIYGVNSRNKGAQLLLAAAAHRLEALGHTPVVSARDVSFSTRREYGARGVFSIEKLRGLRSFGLNLAPRQISNLLPVAGDGAFDYVLDASGFSLTDSWGMAPINSRLSRLSRWDSQGIRLSMLPQAFGPFDREDVRSGVARVFQYAESIWARDADSADYVTRATGGRSAVEIAPDITILLPAHSRPEANGKTILVPNWNLAQRGGVDGRERYVSSLATTARQLQAAGHDLVGLCHEGPKDLELINEVASRVKGITVLNPDSGTACKDIIAGSRLVVAGRYHALVSALSSGVPVVGHSWSHKYQALMDDFGVTDGLADPMDPSQTVERVASLDVHSERKRLEEVLPIVQARVSRVWESTGALLSARA